MNKVWKPINNFCDYYINKNGEIIKIGCDFKYKNINTYKKENGYIQVSLYDKNTKKCIKKYVHRLVAEAFIPNPKNKPCINHIDGNKENNNVSNLEWCTYKENMQHSSKTGLLSRKYGEKNKNSKKYVELDINYNFIRCFIGSRQENKKLGYTKDTIQRCARGVTLETHNKIYLIYDDYFENDIEKTKLIHYQKHKKYIESRKNKGGDECERKSFNRNTKVNVKTNAQIR